MDLWDMNFSLWLPLSLYAWKTYLWLMSFSNIYYHDLQGVPWCYKANINVLPFVSRIGRNIRPAKRTSCQASIRHHTSWPCDPSRCRGCQWRNEKRRLVSIMSENTWLKSFFIISLVHPHKNCETCRHKALATGRCRIFPPSIRLHWWQAEIFHNIFLK